MSSLRDHVRESVAIGQQGEHMEYKNIIALWFVFAVAVIYWDSTRWEDKGPLSECHKAPVMVYNDKYLCIECEKWCEVKK